jgi:hypothetical protein
VGDEGGECHSGMDEAVRDEGGRGVEERLLEEEDGGRAEGGVVNPDASDVARRVLATTLFPHYVMDKRYEVAAGWHPAEHLTGVLASWFFIVTFCLTLLTLGVAALVSTEQRTVSFTPSSYSEYLEFASNAPTCPCSKTGFSMGKFATLNATFDAVCSASLFNASAACAKQMACVGTGGTWGLGV